MSDVAIMAAIIVVAVVLFVWNKLPVVVVAMGTALALYATGVLSLDDALSGLGDPAVIFIATLFIVSAGLEATGVTVAERVPHALPANPHNARYLATKRDRTGHQL